MASRDPQRPNLLFILADDLGSWALGCAGNREARTPNLDRLAASGLRCENLFCASPVCSPARASLLTGRLPSQHGVHDWLRAGNTHDRREEPEGEGRVIEYLAGIPGYTDLLAAAGYRCGLSGKWHLGDAHHPQKGFSYWRVHAKGGGPYYGAPMVCGDEVVKGEGYVTDLITDNALDFLETCTLGEAAPFCLQVHYTAPHSPWERHHHPPDLWDSYHALGGFASTPSDLAPPAWVERVSIPVRDAATRRAYLSGYYAALTAMDAGIGRLLDWLEARDLRRDTLVVFTSDNGMSMGHHGLYGKGNASFPLNLFDSAVKVPGIFSQPGVVPSGQVSHDLISHLDILPTLGEFLGFETAGLGRLPGRSVAPLLQGRALAEQDAAVVVFDEYGPARMIRTVDWKYVHRYPYGPNELYHLREDPDETVNRADQPETRERQAALLHQLETWFLRHVEPDRDGLREAVTGHGQLDCVGPAARRWPRFA
ncbi:MAG: sulfatase-like hydrolase/transferase [Lentisphaerae bacterium]|nr:sulfatase-like hydrolase/transferase [Lentisphaerota bacterium]